MWKNKINEKRYIGSSQNLRKRFKEYFNTNHLLINTWYEHLQSSGKNTVILIFLLQFLNIVNLLNV